MLPGLIHRVMAGLALVVLALAVLAWPARHVLAPLWPQTVEERIVLEADGSVQRQFISSAMDPPSNQNLVARNRPQNLLRVETRDSQQFYAFLSGVREAGGESLVRQLPPWLAEPRIDPVPESGQVLVMTLADEETREVPVAHVRRLYRPNRMGMGERALMAWQSLGEAILGQRAGSQNDDAGPISPGDAEMR